MSRFRFAWPLCLASMLSVCSVMAGKPRMSPSQALRARSTVLSTVERPGKKGGVMRETLMKVPGMKYPLITSLEIVDSAPAPSQATPSTEMVANQLLVKFASTIDAAQIEDFCKTSGFSVVQPIDDQGLMLMTIPGVGYDELIKAIALARADSRVEYAETNAVIYATATPNDPEYHREWNMKIIQAPAAWDSSIGKGDSKLAVAVLDSGIDLTHPDLANNIWNNPDEDYDGNGLPRYDNSDNDASGKVDDYFGWDIVDMDNDPSDLSVNGHGTHIAGVIGGYGDNNLGIAGLNWRVKIASVRILNDQDVGLLSDAVLGINYASNQPELLVTSNSWGMWLSPDIGAPEDPNEQGRPAIISLRNAIQNTNNKGKIFVCAAGNDGWDLHEYWTDVHGHRWFWFPPYLGNTVAPDDNVMSESFENTVPALTKPLNMITVAATDPDDYLADYSNYCPKRVHMAAPGGLEIPTSSSVFSTLPTAVNSEGYGYMAGTSVAAPHVAAAVLFKIWNWYVNGNLPDYTGTDKFHHRMRAQLIGTGDQLPSLFGWIDSYSRLNLYKALRTTKYLRLLAPVGTENLRAGRNMHIRWVSSLDGLIKIDLYKGGAFFMNVVDGADEIYVDHPTGGINDDHGTYDWTIPNDLEAGGDYTLRITALSTGTYDQSYSYFSIVNSGYFLTLKVSPTAGGTTVPAPAVAYAVNPADVIAVSATAYLPYVFDRWFVTPSATINDPFAADAVVTIDPYPPRGPIERRVDGHQNVTVTARFKVDATDLLILQMMRYPTPWGTTDPFPGNHYVVGGTPIDVEAIPLVKPPHVYAFLRWDTLNANPAWNPNFTIVDPLAALTSITPLRGTRLLARFYRLTDYLSVTSTTGGIIVTPRGRTVQLLDVSPLADPADDIPITADLVDPDYEFICWSHSKNVTIDDVTAMSANASLEWDIVPDPPGTSIPASTAGWVKAIFKPIGSQATLTIMPAVPAAGGTVVDPPGKYPEAPHTVVPITATANAGYAFTTWSVTGDGEVADLLNPATTITVHWNCTVTPNFIRTYQLTTATQGPGTVTTPAGNPTTVNVGEWEDIVATPDAGGTFIMWRAGPGATIENRGLATTRVKLTQDATVTAVFVTTANMDNVAYGSVIPINAGSVPGLGANFPVKPRVTAYVFDPTKKVFRSASLSVVGFVPGAATVNCKWTSAMSLIDAKMLTQYYLRRTVSGDGNALTFVATEQDPITPLPMILKVKTPAVDVELDQGVFVMPPSLTGVEARNGDSMTPPAAAHAGAILILRGEFFTGNAPAVWLENEGTDGIITRVRCASYRPYAYPNALLKPNTSPMDVNDLVNGVSELYVKIPNKLPDAWNYAANHNVVIQTRHGVASILFNTQLPTTNTLPVAVDDATAVAVGSRGNIIDVLANDVDAEADDVRIILGTPDNGGRVSVVNRRVVYTPASGFTGVETFTYMLDDHYSDGVTSNVATVTVNVP